MITQPQRVLRSLLGVTAILSGSSASAEFREWTSLDNHKVEAELVGLEEYKVKLRRRDGKVITIPIEKLSDDDQTYAVVHAKDVPPPAEPVPPPSDAAPSAPTGWPRTTELTQTPTVKVASEDAKTRNFVYQTEHFEFRCDAKLGADVVREFARLFEGTLVVNKALPLGINPKPEHEQERFVARLFSSKEDYVTAGGSPASAGVYAAGPGYTMCPLESLGVKLVGKRYGLDRDVDNRTLIHELTHQVMHRWLRKLPVWYAEGSAEYVTAQKYQRGRFSLAAPGDNVREYLADRRGLDGRRFTMWHLYHLMKLDSKTLHASMATDPAATLRTYASSLLLTYYFYHVDGNGDATDLIAWIRGTESGGKHAALTPTHLLRGRSYADLEKDLEKTARKLGFALEFTGEAEPSSKSAAGN